jgi:phasin family protein
MPQPFEDANKLGKEFLEANMKSLATLSKSVQAIAAETGEYTKKSFETGSAALEKLFSAKSLDKAFEIQTDFARKAYEGFVAEATKLGELYTETARDAYKPFEGLVAKTK